MGAGQERWGGAAVLLEIRELLRQLVRRRSRGDVRVTVIVQGLSLIHIWDKAVRVYSYAPHAHLIEEGHRMVTHDGREVGFVKGHHVFEVAAKGFESEFYTDLDDFLSGEVVEKL